MISKPLAPVSEDQNIKNWFGTLTKIYFDKKLIFNGSTDHYLWFIVCLLNLYKDLQKVNRYQGGHHDFPEEESGKVNLFILESNVYTQFDLVLLSKDIEEWVTNTLTLFKLASRAEYGDQD